MNWHAGRVLVTLFLIGVVLLPGKPLQAQTTYIPIQAGSLAMSPRGPITDGAYVAWLEYGMSYAGGCPALVAAPLADLWEPTRIIFSGSSYAISDGILIWENLTEVCERGGYRIFEPGIYGLDLSSGDSIVVSPDPVAELRLANGKVVWSVVDDEERVYAIRMRDVSGGATLSIAEFEPSTQIMQLRFDGKRVSWIEAVRNETHGRLMSVVLGQEPAELMAIPDLSLFHWFDIQNNWLVWITGTHLQARNLTTGEQVSISEDAQSAYSSDGRYVLWANAHDLGLATLHAYDLKTMSHFVVQNRQSPTREYDYFIDTSSIRGGALVWQYRVHTPGVDYAEGLVITGAYLSNILPTGARPQPDASDPAWTYYPETGHYLANQFRAHWESNGALPTFGYPITEEFEEQGSTVQFTERQRFEWHPENLGTPYQVLLGRLGAELLTLQGRDWTTFPKADPDTSHYFVETGHAIAPEFWDYWSNHGLEFGDSGVTFRESLALFGYPLSQPIIETNSDGHTVLTQYFERAVFEYHPDNHDPYQVLLRRLGAEILADREWIER
jgi:hypothetical protein